MLSFAILELISGHSELGQRSMNKKLFLPDRVQPYAVSTHMFSSY